MKRFKSMLPLFALLLGFGLVFTQSAFTPKSAVPTHYNSNPGLGMPIWTELGDKVVGTEEGEYRCLSAPTRPCLASINDDEEYNIEAYGNFVPN